MKNIWKSSIAMVLAFCMLLSMPITSFAANDKKVQEETQIDDAKVVKASCTSVDAEKYAAAGTALCTKLTAENSNAPELTSVNVTAKAGQTLVYENLDFTNARVLMLVAAVGKGSGGNQIDLYADEVSDSNRIGVLTLHGDKASDKDFSESYADLTQTLTGSHTLILKFQKELIAKAESMDLTGYTAESVEAFNSALQKAKDVMADETLNKENQVVVDAAVNLLQAAIDGLVKEEEKPETDKPETDKPETDKPETDKPETDKPETNKPETNNPETGKPDNGPAQTGDIAPVFVMGVVALVSMMAVVILRKKNSYNA